MTRLTMMWMLAACLLSAQAPPAPAKAKAQVPATETLYDYRARVLATGTDQPVASVKVSITTKIDFSTPADPDKFRNMRTFSATSDQQGEFVVQLPAGDFTYSVTAEGYALDNAIRPNITIAAGKTPERGTIRVLRAVSISGIVEDADGKPLSGARMYAMSLANVAQTKVTERTSADGKFVIPSLLPGSYLLRADMEAAQGSTATFVNTYYPGTTDSFAAAEIMLYGVDVPNLRILMQKAEFHSVRGRVTGRESNSFAAQNVRLESIEDPRAMFGMLSRARRTGSIASDGTFSIGNVPPGRYEATVQGDRARVLFPLALQEIRVSDRDIADLRLAVAPGGILSGKVIVEKGDAPTKWGLHMSGRSAAGTLGTDLAIDKDGLFSIDGVPNGTYGLSLFASLGLSVSSVEIGGRKYEGGKFPFAVPGSADVVVRVSAGGATIQGTLAGSRNPEQPVSGIATIVLEATLTEGVYYRRNTPLAKDGSFSITNLDPGRYLACAWSDYSERVALLFELPQPPLDRLRQLCKTVDVKAGGSESVELRLATFAEVTR